MATLISLLEQGIQLEAALAGVDPGARRAARRRVREELAAGGRDPDGRCERLVDADVARMSEGQLVEAVQAGEEQGGFWGRYLAALAAERLEREFGYGWIEVDEARAAELGA